MADIKVNRESQGEQSRQVQRQQQRDQGVSRRGEFPSLFSLSPREFFSMNPFEMMRRFTDEMDRAFSGFRGGEERFWAPPVEVRQKDNNLIVSAELPGLNKEEVKLNVTDEGLTIEGERKREHEERKEGVYRSERSYGHFHRFIPLPEDANIDQARASFNNGVLEVTIPVPQRQEKRREIPIETGGQTRTAGG